MKQEIESGGEYNLKSFVTQHLINESIASNAHMVEWIRCAKETIKNNKKSKKNNDIRKFFIAKRKGRIERIEEKENG